MESIRILLVEDDAMKAKLITRVLTRAATAVNRSVSITHLTNLYEASCAIDDVRRRVAAPLDLVVSDWCFPLHAGDFATKGAGAHVMERASEIPARLIVVSGDARPERFQGVWAQTDQCVLLLNQIITEIAAAG